MKDFIIVALMAYSLYASPIWNSNDRVIPAIGMAICIYGLIYYAVYCIKKGVLNSGFEGK